MLTFTIITCTYNASQYIDRTLDSVLRQTYPHIDHLIIDGLSKDDTMEKVKKYAEMKSPHSIRIICEKDNGLYDAMNKGIDLSVGHFLIFLNAGDTFTSATTLADIAKQVEGMKELPAVIYGDTDIVNEVSLRLSIWTGRASSMECWSAISLSMPILTSANTCITT